MTCWWGCHYANKLSRLSLWGALHSVSNIHIYFGNHEWVCPICPELCPIVYIPINSQLVIKTVENHDRNQKIKGTFICWPLFFKWMGVSQSWWDSFSIGIWAFIQNISFSSSVVFIYWCPFVTIWLQFAVSLHFFSSASNCIRYFPSSLQ